MIALLSGRVHDQGEDWVILDTGGEFGSVGYLLFCSAKTLARLPTQNNHTRLLVETHVREDHIHLFGFWDNTEKKWFKLLTSVNGVGTKAALAILSTLSPAALGTAIAAGDKGAIAQSKGIGPKIAQRLVTELKDKMGSLAQQQASSAQNAQGLQDSGLQVADEIIADIVSALSNLGYGPAQAMEAAVRVKSRLDNPEDFDAFFRATLSELAGGGS